MATATDSVTYTPGGQPIKIVDPSETGFNAMNAESFLKLLITQLQNQDPSAPMSNEELLGQISTMRDLQSSIELSDTLDSLAASQTSSSQTQLAASLIGKELVAYVDDGTLIPGVAESAVIEDGQAFVKVSGLKIPVDNVVSISEPS